MVNKTAQIVFVSIILTILIVSIANVGLSILLEQPRYEDFCGEYKEIPEKMQSELVCVKDVKTCKDGTTLSRDPEMGCDFPSCSKEFETCQDEYDNVMREYNQVRYYVFASLGFILLLVGLFSGFNMIQMTGFFSGAILLSEGIILNFQNKKIVFFSLLIILIIFGLAAWKITNKK